MPASQQDSARNTLNRTKQLPLESSVQNAQTLAQKILDPSAPTPPVVRPVTHVAFLLDRSGSMAQHQKGAVDAINGLIATTKESAKDQDILVSFYQDADDAGEMQLRRTTWNGDETYEQ